MSHGNFEFLPPKKENNCTCKLVAKIQKAINMARFARSKKRLFGSFSNYVSHIKCQLSQISLDSLLFSYEELFPPLSQLLYYMSCRGIQRNFSTLKDYCLTR